MTKKRINNMSQVIARLITTPEDMQMAFAVREEVFIKEQQVSRKDEFDEFEEESFHFLATIDGVSVGAARWRITDNGGKLERFAVEAKYRGIGVGKALVEAVLTHIDQTNFTGKLYLHAQLEAIPLYAHFGFEIVGEQFTECDIEHQTMELLK